jgi:hypothetical protein
MTDSVDVDGPADGLPIETTQDVRWLRAQGDRHDRLVIERAALEQDLVLRQSGIDIDTPQGRLFRLAFQGPFNVETLRHEARRYGVPFVGAPATPAEPDHDSRYAPSGEKSRNIPGS